MKRYIIIIMISIIPFILNAHGNYFNNDVSMMCDWSVSNIFWWIAIPIILLLIIVVIMAFTKSTKKDTAAFDILKIRYAKGEISKEEFENMRKNIIENS